MNDNIIILGVALLFGYYWIAAPNATYKQRLNRAFIMAIIIGLCVASFF